MARHAGIHSRRVFLKDNRGQTLVEYGLLLMLIAIVVIAILFAVGRSTNNMYSAVNSAVLSVTSGGG